MTKKNPIINFFTYSKSSLNDKEKLFNIIYELKEKNDNLIVNVKKLVESGNFERLSRFLMPYTLNKVLAYDTRKNITTVFYNNNRKYINSNPFNDTLKYMVDSKNLTLISDHAEYPINPNALIDDIFNHRKSEVVLKDIKDSYIDEVETPISDREWLKYSTDNSMKGKLPHHYLLSSRKSYNLVKKFEKAIIKEIPNVQIPKDEATKTWLYSMIFNDFRLTTAKVSTTSKPVIYTDRVENTETVLKCISDSKNCVIEDWDKDIKVVDNQKVINFILKQSKVTNDPKLPISDVLTNPKLYRYLYTLGEGNNLSTAKNKKQFDVISKYKAVTDKNNKVMRPAYTK